MNEKFQYRTRPGIENLELIVSKLVQVNPDNSWAVGALA